MSALTDLFSAMATKIRSKTGTATTYTPSEMVSDGIDDVYDAGVAAGTTPTQTKTVTAGTSNVTVRPDTGYALSQVTVQPTPTETASATPTTSAQTVSPSSGKYLSSVSVGAIPSEYIIPSGNKSITANGTGIDVKNYATASVSVPNPTLSGDASASDVRNGKTFYNSDYTLRTGSMTITDVTPSSSGTYFASGITNMSTAGYAYSSQPQPTETTLWTNSSPTSSYSSSSGITIGSDAALQEYRYFKIVFRKSTSDSTEFNVTISYDDYIASGTSSVGRTAAYGWWQIADGGSTWAHVFRTIRKKSTTSSSMLIGGCTVMPVGVAGSTDNSILIPLQIIGIKY